MSRADDIIERALTAPVEELGAVEREIEAFIDDPSSTDEDIVRVRTAAECVALTLWACHK
jgi:hypothetical protein